MTHLYQSGRKFEFLRAQTVAELEIDGTKCTENLKIANGQNEFFPTVGAKLNDQARVSSQVINTNVSAIDPCTLAIPKFAFEIVSNNEVS